MPVTLKCIIEKNNVDENVAKFMLPIGSAINMDGTALYEGEFIENLSINDNRWCCRQRHLLSFPCNQFNNEVHNIVVLLQTAVAVIFIAQLRGIDLSFGKLVAIR